MLFLLISSLPAIGSADPNASTDDRSVPVATKWWLDVGVSLATLQSDLTRHGARLTGIEVDTSVSPETFTATMVADSGAYKVASWSWGVDQTSAQITALKPGGWRLIDLYPYQSTSGEEYTYVAVANSGASTRSWWYDVDTDPTTIQNDLNSNGARLEEVRSYLIGGTEHYSAIMVAQSGIDAKNWTWTLNSSVTYIQNLLNSYHYRLISLEPNPLGGYDAVLVQSYGETWWWYTAKTEASVRSRLAANHARPITIAGGTGGQGFDVIMIDDTDAQSAAINAESKRVAALMAKGVGQSDYGLYLAKVGGPELLGFNENFRFEPASAIKVLYLLYAMTQVQAGADSLSDDFVYYPDPSDPYNPGVCPDPAWEVPSDAVHTTLQAALTAMMDQSDNRMTRGMVLRYGISNVNSYAQSIGMTSTHLVQDRIGCLFVNGVRNQITLRDAGSLYSQVDDGSLLTPANESTFYSTMLGGAVPSASPLGDVVRQEAAKQGKSSDAASFIAGMSYREKAGNEFQCVSADCGTSPMYLDFTSVAGEMTLPFKSGGNLVPTDYVYGRFANDFVIDCVPGSSACASDTNEVSAISTLGKWGSETYRQQIAAALATW